MATTIDVRDADLDDPAHAAAVQVLVDAYARDPFGGVAVCFLGFSTFQGRSLVNVHDLAVLPEYRGRGVGRALLAAVEERARARGCCKLTLEVLDENVRARGLYRSVGFADGALPDSTSTRFLTKQLTTKEETRP